MIKAIFFIALYLIAFIIYCCLVVGSRHDDEIEKLNKKEVTHKSGL